MTSQYTVYISTILTDLDWETCTDRLLHWYDSYYIRGDVTVYCLHIHDINWSGLGDLHWSIVTFVRFVLYYGWRIQYTVYISTILTDLDWETCTGRLLHLYTCTIRIILGVTYTVYCLHIHDINRSGLGDFYWSIVKFVSFLGVFLWIKLYFWWILSQINVLSKNGKLYETWLSLAQKFGQLATWYRHRERVGRVGGSGVKFGICILVCLHFGK